MRIFRGLENIHSVIERHEAEWRREQGEEPSEHPDRISLEEAVRRRLTAQPDAGSGRFSADRFLNGKSEPKHKPEPEPEHQLEITEAAIPETEPQVEAVEVIKSNDGRHSWLYNEVMKAINDAAKDRKNTKIIAVFIPVIQNGKEFQDLPADETVTLSSVSEEDSNVIAVPEPENEPEITEAEEPEAAPEVPEAAEISEISELPDLQEDEPEHEELPDLPDIAEVPETQDEQEQEQEVPLSEDFNLLPEPQETPDPELAEAFREMEEKLDESIQEAHEQEQEQEIITSEIGEPEELQEELPAIDDVDVETDGEAMNFKDIEDVNESEPAEVIEPEITLPDELDDDEVFDGSDFDGTLTDSTKIHNASDDDEAETIIIQEPEEYGVDDDENKEVEVMPDPEK